MKYVLVFSINITNMNAMPLRPYNRIIFRVNSDSGYIISFGNDDSMRSI